VFGGLSSSEQHIIAIIGIWAIIFGCILSGVANGCSTILAWENEVDPKILDLQRQVSALANSVALLEIRMNDARIQNESNSEET
jgi:hypothetical protein